MCVLYILTIIIYIFGVIYGLFDKLEKHREIAKLISREIDYRINDATSMAIAFTLIILWPLVALYKVSKDVKGIIKAIIDKEEKKDV